MKNIIIFQLAQAVYNSTRLDSSSPYSSLSLREVIAKVEKEVCLK